ncbi:MAG: phenylalanine--tRNA ligase subunit beta [Bacteroidota bacterium]
MKISYNWLKEYIDFNHSPEELSEILTQTGLEVEGVEKKESIPGGLEGLVIGKVEECTLHPNADKLKLTKVNIGQEELLPIVCGAPNVEVGQKVIVAPVNTVIHPMEGEPFKIKKAKIRGETSQGMICAEDEIGLGNDHDGIMVLPPEVEIGKAAKDHFELEDDYIIEIGLTPNRADAASHIGTARDVKAIVKNELKWPSVEDFKVDDQSLTIPVTVKNEEACPRYSAVTISDIEVKESPDWLKTRLRSIGLAPINNIVDITNFVLHELGQPLHAFDADKIIGKEVIVQTVDEGTTFTTLDEKERKLSSSDLMICNQSEGMCIAGVFGGTKSGMTDSTKNVFLESAYFSAEYIRATAQRYGLKTDASFRYERGTDPDITVYALKRAALLIKEIAGGKISSKLIDIYPKEILPFKVKVKYKHIDRLIGKNLSKDAVHSILDSLDITAEEKNDEAFVAVVPPYRVDVQREADVIEEILRIYGYNNIELNEGTGSTFLSDFAYPDVDTLMFKTGELLASNGYFEIISNSLTNPKYAEESSFLEESESVEIYNKLSSELGVMRQTPIYSGLEAIAHNVNRKNKNLKFFEFSKTYKSINEKYKEKNLLCLFLTGDLNRESWKEKTKTVQYHDLLATVLKVLKKYSFDDVQLEQEDEPGFEYSLSLKLHNAEVGKIGSLDHSTRNLSGVEQDVFYAELDWDKLTKIAAKSYSFEEISKFPSVRRDLSLVLDKSVNFQQVRDLALKQERKLIKDIDVFDVYEGKNLGENKKAYAISFILEDNSKTLTDKIIDKVMSQMMRVFEKELGAVIRK